MDSDMDRSTLSELLARSGFVAADEEATELLARADGDASQLAELVERRLGGEPLAWVTGSVTFCGLSIRVDPGVYVPRWQSEPLALRAAARLPAAGVAIDLCTGAGAIALVLSGARPGARVVATDNDEVAVACAAANGVHVYCGDLFAPLPHGYGGQVDVVVAVVPYVPTSALDLLPHHTLEFEPIGALHGGPDGTDLLRRVMRESTAFLRPGGALLLELGGEQAGALRTELSGLGYVDVEELRDDDGDVRGVEATWAGRVAPT
jgi:release factor glutamine methyltransferase